MQANVPTWASRKTEVRLLVCARARVLVSNDRHMKQRLFMHGLKKKGAFSFICSCPWPLRLGLRVRTTMSRAEEGVTSVCVCVCGLWTLKTMANSYFFFCYCLFFFYLSERSMITYSWAVCYHTQKTKQMRERERTTLRQH